MDGQLPEKGSFLLISTFLKDFCVPGSNCEKIIPGRPLARGRISSPHLNCALLTKPQPNLELTWIFVFTHQADFDIFYHFLKGNQSRAFLKKIDLLQQNLEQECDDVILNGLPFIQTFRAFSAVVDFCFGVKLKPGYEDKIKDFKKSYLSLGITVTPKVKIVF